MAQQRFTAGDPPGTPESLGNESLTPSYGQFATVWESSRPQQQATHLMPPYHQHASASASLQAALVGAGQQHLVPQGSVLMTEGAPNAQTATLTTAVLPPHLIGAPSAHWTPDLHPGGGPAPNLASQVNAALLSSGLQYLPHYDAHQQHQPQQGTVIPLALLQGLSAAAPSAPLPALHHPVSQQPAAARAQALPAAGLPPGTVTVYLPVAQSAPQLGLGTTPAMMTPGQLDAARFTTGLTATTSGSVFALPMAAAAAPHPPALALNTNAAAAAVAAAGGVSGMAYAAAGGAPQPQALGGGAAVTTVADLAGQLESLSQLLERQRLLDELLDWEQAERASVAAQQATVAAGSNSERSSGGLPVLRPTAASAAALAHPSGAGVRISPAPSIVSEPGPAAGMGQGRGGGGGGAGGGSGSGSSGALPRLGAHVTSAPTSARAARRESVEGEGEASSSLYIRNLPPDADDLYLYRRFSPFGAITSCRVLLDPDSGFCRGIGFVNYVDVPSALRATEAMHGARTSHGRLLDITLQQPRAVRAASAAARTAAAVTARARASGLIVVQQATDVPLAHGMQLHPHQ